MSLNTVYLGGDLYFVSRRTIQISQALASPEVASQAQNTESGVTTGAREQQVTFSELVGHERIQANPHIGHMDPMYAESIRSFLTRPYPVANGTWTGSQTTGSLVDAIPLMSQYLVTANTIRDKITGFKYIRGGMRVSMRVNGTKFHHGLMVLAFYPLDSAIGGVGANRRNAASATMMPSIFVNPTSDGVEELDVPFVYQDQFIKLDDRRTNEFGDVRLYILDSLKAVNQTTVGAISWTMYAHFVDPVLTGFTHENVDVTPTIVVQGYTGESATRVVPEFLNGFNTDGSDPSISAGIIGYPSGSDPQTELAFQRSDMDLKHIYTYPNYIAATDWSSDTNVGVQIMHVTVHPGYTTLSPGNTFLKVLSGVTGFWRGALRYKVMVVASAFHSGRLQISWNPTTAVGSGAVIPDLANSNHIVLDLQQTTEVYFTVPYLHHKPWQHVQSFSQAAALSFNILNRLATPSGTTSTVRILVWAYGSDTLQFAVPRIRTLFPVPASALPLADDDVIEVQCYKLPLDDSRFGKMGDASDVADTSCIGERITSVLQLTRKLAFAGTAVSTASQDTFTYRPFNRKNGLIQLNTHVAGIGSMYLAIRGPLRVAATVDTLAAGEVVSNEQYYIGIGIDVLGDAGISGSNAGGPSDFGFALVRPDSAPNPSLILPWYSNKLFAINNQASNLDITTVYPSFSATKFNGPAPIGVFRFFMSTTDDTQFGYLIAPL